jgi:ComF family protein
LKYEEEPWIGISIGRLMADQRELWSEIPKPDWILPVPLHDSRHQERGYNQSEIIAREMGARLGWPVRTDVLKRILKTPAQMELAAERREANVRGAFASTGSLKGYVVLLVDDVATTCATLKSCGRTLKAAGAQEVFGLTWARQPLENS